MKRDRHVVAALVAAAMFSSAASQTCRGQDDDDLFGPRSRAPRYGVGVGAFVPHANPPLGAQIHEATAQLRDATTDEERAAKLTSLKELLANYFDEDLDRREQSLANLEDRVKKLRDQLDSRRQKKSEIIELQVKVAIHEADGLGFYSQPKDDGMFNFRVPVPVAMPSAGAVWVPPPAEIRLEPPAPVSADGKPSATEIPR